MFRLPSNNLSDTLRCFLFVPFYNKLLIKVYIIPLSVSVSLVMKDLSSYYYFLDYVWTLSRNPLYTVLNRSNGLRSL